MTKLLIDTSQQFILIGIVHHNEVFEKIIPHSNQLGSKLSLCVLELLSAHHIPLEAISEIRIGVGPGSYTGTRVGCAFAEALGYGLNIPVTKVPSLIFYLTEGQTALILKSKFDTCGFLSLNGDSYHYMCTAIDEIPFSIPILDPKTIQPKPDWKMISEVESKDPLKELLYFALN